MLKRVHVVIVGCGRVGSTLALELVAVGHTVAVIDRKPEAFKRLGENFSGLTIAGIGFDRDVLQEAGIEKAQAVAAVTNGDNSNILIARVAREKFGIEKVVARIYDPKRAEIYERLGVATVATVKWTSERILRRILPDISSVEWTDPSSNVVLIEREFPNSLAGKRSSRLSYLVPEFLRFADSALRSFLMKIQSCSRAISDTSPSRSVLLTS